MISENDWENCCVGLGANPDETGVVTLDACIMDHQFGIGCVAGLERIKNPIQVARAVMEKTPHVFLIGDGAQKFALSQGHILQSLDISEHAQKAFDEFKKKNKKFTPVPNIENGFNHDTIGMIAMDQNGNLSGACTTSGMGFKMRGRVGDSPIIGAGLFVDNEVGAATATGNGEEVIRICGSHMVVEFMRQGLSPSLACKKAVERIFKASKNLQNVQIGFIAINKKGQHGGYALKKGFDYTLHDTQNTNKKVIPQFLI
jgi:N4-(beta-N-acetylglucosaminyl)-L-asparaginase